MIRVMLADDHNLVRQGIRSLLEKAEDIEIIAEAENGQEAIELVQELTPDVLVMDIAMPRLSGIQAAEQLHLLEVETRIVILSMHSDETLVRQALRNGVRGYLLKRSVSEELLLAIRAADAGEIYLSPAISKQLIMSDFVTGPVSDEGEDVFHLLSPREREVLQLIAEGYTNKTIAKTLDVSVKTVEKHRSKVMTKLDVKDLPSLIRIAIKRGLIFLDD